jgi:cell division protein FtsA
MKERIVTGIDLGSHSVKVAIARVQKNGDKFSGSEIIGTGVAESRGIKHGYITSPADVARSVTQALKKAEKIAGVTVKRAHVAVGGIGLEEYYTRGEIIPARADSEITSSDVEKVIQTAEENVLDKLSNRRMLYSIPIQYKIDSSVILGRPTGNRGTKFEVQALIIATFSQHVDDIIAAIEGTGVYVDDVIASPLAASFVLLNNQQKRAGCVLVNIGSDTTSVVAYEDDVPVTVKIFPVGSRDITNDIALRLRVPLEEAEKIKRGGMTSARFSKKQLDEIIAERYVSIFTTINTHLEKLELSGNLPAGVILTGGGANPSTIALDAAKRTLELPACVATIEIGRKNKLRDTTWGVAYGLCTWGAAGQQAHTAIGVAKQAKSQAFNWIKQFLP